MKLTKNNLIKKLGITDEGIISVITEYKDKLPILTEEGEGFCVNARDFYRELKLKDTFGTWIKNTISNLELQKDIDYSEWFKQVATDYTDDEIECMPINKRNALGITTEYSFTMEISKEIAMVIGAMPRVNKETKKLSKLTRKYFIAVEKILKLAMEWERIRKPEKEEYKVMCKELDLFMQRNYGKKAETYHYINEADTLNKICLGATAKKIKEYIDAQDENTRNWLTVKYNLYLSEMQRLNTMYLRMNMDKEIRYNLLKQGFKVTYPEASFGLIGEEAVN